MSLSPEPPPAAAAVQVTLLRLAGRDALDVLHRISTAQLADLAPGQARWTLFCDFRGRLQHRALVAVTSDRAVWLLRDDAPGADLAAFIDRSVFREDVRIEEHAAGRTVRRVFEPDGRSGAPLAHGHLLEHEGVPVVARSEHGESLEVVSGTVTDPLAHERARIEAGLPRHGHEIRDEFHPFEVGLARDIHLSKGCYTGQEVLLRLMTYRSVRRRLALLEGADPAPPPLVDATVDGERAGRITSVHGGDGAWRALAVLAHAACEPGVPVRIAGAGAVSRVAPFPEHRPPGLP